MVDDEYIYQTGQNNGRIVQSIDNVLGETVNYTYDSLNRLSSAEEATGKWGNAFSYDGWGNMNGQTWTPGQPAAAGGSGFGYGNLNFSFGGGGPTYNVENQLVSEPPCSSGGQCVAVGNNFEGYFGDMLLNSRCCNRLVSIFGVPESALEAARPAFTSARLQHPPPSPTPYPLSPRAQRSLFPPLPRP